MNARVAFASFLSLAVLLPSLTQGAEIRVKRKAAPPWARPNSGNNYWVPPGHARPGNKFGGQTDHNGGGGPPGWGGGNGPPGLNGGSPPGWNHGKPTDYGDGNKEENKGKPGKGPSGNEDAGSHDPDRKPDRGQDYQGCKQDEFFCGSKECVPLSARCNNQMDCRDSSDEQDCYPAHEVVGCALPDQPEGGSYALGGCPKPCFKHPGDKVPRNSVLTYNCSDNYVLNGNTISVCINDEWTTPPSCTKTCPVLSSSSVKISCFYQGEEISCNEPVKSGTKATLMCKRSYKLPLTEDPAYRQINCLDNGLWDRPVFRCLPECGTSIAQGNTLVVNGFDAKLGIFPWHVGIYNKNSDSEYEQICGGSLISNNLVVTAAHCFYDESQNTVREKSNFAVAGGKHYRDWNANENYVQKSTIAEIHMGERYIGARGNFAQDIAVIKLATPFELTVLVRPVCLDWDDTYEREQLQTGKSGKAVGWGKTINGVSSEILQELNMPYVPYDQCLSTVPEDFRGYITSDKFCAGYLNGSGLCDGDSGGGLCFEKQGTWYLRGITSVGPVKDGGCDHHSYVVFTCLSYFREWIRSIYVQS